MTYDNVVCMDTYWTEPQHTAHVWEQDPECGTWRWIATPHLTPAYLVAVA